VSSGARPSSSRTWDRVEVWFPLLPRLPPVAAPSSTATVAPLAIDGQLPVVGVVQGLIKDKEALIADLAQRLELPARRCARRWTPMSPLTTSFH